MTHASLLTKFAGLLLLGGATWTILYVLISSPHSLPNRYWSAYIAHLERKLREMFLQTRGTHIAWVQLAIAGVVSAFGIYFQIPFWWASLALIAVAPPMYIESLRRDRVKLIESRMDGFTLTLANALKTTPSIGNALSYAQPLVMPPMNEELALAIKEMRVGNTVDQALLNMSARIRSMQLDAALAGILIGRQVGGDLPKILETTANTLREMARLQGILRAKTSEGRIQVGVLAAVPAFLLIGFDAVKPGYFEPITSSAIGWAIIVVAVVLWLAALVIARQVLRVEV